MIRLMLILVGCVALVTVALLGFRGSKSDKPPLMPFLDMVDQQKYMPQSESRYFADGRSQRLPPEHAVPWGRKAERADPEFATADADLFELKKMPLAMDRALLVRGREKYAINCAVCHGLSGKGDGIVTKYGLVPPPSYHSDRIREMPDGEFYKVITLGKGKMGSYADKLAREDRWAVIAYVRALQRAQNAKLEDVPEEARKELSK